MTCHRVPMSPSLCTCGVVLDITVWHGEDDIGNDLCPTCSGCGCEPNERQNMTPDQIKALPVGSVVLDHRGCAWQKHPDGGWVARFDDHTTGALADDERLVLIHDPSAAPEPDHSMCARHDPSLRRAIQEAIGEASVCWDNMSGAGVFDVARANAVADRLCAILDIPEPEPSVEDRAFKALTRFGWLNSPRAVEIIEAFIAAGLLVRDGEQ